MACHSRQQLRPRQSRQRRQQSRWLACGRTARVAPRPAVLSTPLAAHGSGLGRPARHPGCCRHGQRRESGPGGASTLCSPGMRCPDYASCHQEIQPRQRAAQRAGARCCKPAVRVLEHTVPGSARVGVQLEGLSPVGSLDLSRGSILRDTKNLVKVHWECPTVSPLHCSCLRGPPAATATCCRQEPQRAGLRETPAWAPWRSYPDCEQAAQSRFRQCTPTTDV